MNAQNATTDSKHEDLVASLTPIEYHQAIGDTGVSPRVQRWIRPADADTAFVSFTVDSHLHRSSASHLDREMFLRLVEQWRTERPAASSSIADIIACPSYLRIIGMGWRALPLIIEQLEREGNEPDHWCAALEAVTGEDPVPEEAQGDSVRIAQAWIAWNRTRVAWSFQTSTTPTIESPATGLRAITASPGLPNPM